MCCFSGHVERVSDTKIFARAGVGERQLLAYSMRVAMKSELAMLLPIPTPAGSAEDAVKFLSLKEYPQFFADCEAGWPAPKGMPPAARGKPFVTAAPKLAVVQVGNFEASFVPGVADFARLDERFRLPDGTWQQLGDYNGWGFAVFKLKAGEQKIHPMAFDFPRRNPDRLFFPTVHVHDGKIHKTAGFDHALYCQSDDAGRDAKWSASFGPAKQFMKVAKAQGLIDGDRPLQRQFLHGRLKNQDTWLA